MAREGLQQAAYAERKAIPIRPVLGYWSFDQGTEMPAGSSPDMLNCIVERGLLRKRPGFSKFPSDASSFGEPVTGLYATQDVNKDQQLLAMTPTGGHKFNVLTEGWEALTPASPFTGDEEDIWQFENSENAFVFSQGVDPIQLLAFDSLTPADLDANAPPARFLCRFNGRLNIGHTFENPDTFPYRHRRPVRGDHTDWTGLGSGFRDQDEFPYHMQGMKKLGTQMILYYEQSIEACIGQPAAAAPFRYETRVGDIGLYAAYTLAGRNDRHFMLGTDDFYSFNGATPQPIGQQVRDDVFATLNTGKLHMMWGIVVPAPQEYLAALVSGGADYPDTGWVFNWVRQIWTKWTIPSHRCAAIYRVDDPITIDELIGTIDEQNWEFDSLAVQTAYPSLLTGTQDGYVMQWSPLKKSDDGDAITCRWTSHDFTAEKVFGRPDRQIVLERLGIEYKGTGAEFDLDISYSVDGGDTWSAPVTITGESHISGLHTMFETTRVTGDRVRFRFQQTSATQTFFISKFIPEFTLDNQLIGVTAA